MKNLLMHFSFFQCDGGANAIAIRTDVSKEADVTDLFVRVDRVYGPPHTSCNNAGISKDRHNVRPVVEDYESYFPVNDA